MPSTIVLFASSRRHGNTGRLIDRLATETPIEVIDLAGRNLSAYDYEHRNRGDDFEALIGQVLEFDQVIFASPVYWYAVSPPMKVFFDRLSDLLDLEELRDQGRRLRGKMAFVACTSVCNEAAPSFVGALCETFSYLGMRFGGLLHANCVDGYEAEKYEPDIRRFIERLAGDAAGART
jgi:multimeric flavodoxin WrbA